MRTVFRIILTAVLIPAGVGALCVGAWVGWQLMVLGWIAFAEMPFRFIHHLLYLRVSDYHSPTSSATDRDIVAGFLTVAFWITVTVLAMPCWRRASRIADNAADAIADWRARRGGDEVSPLGE